MENYLIEVAHLILRYFHVIAGIAWIGASFYFAWLDNSLQTPPKEKSEKGVSGDLWAIHGGGFYEVAKYKNGPEQMPTTLHWFKWEAYTTWITGILLFSLLYYIGADANLLDASKSELSKVSAITTSLGSIAVGYIVYRFLCNSPLVSKGYLFTTTIIALLTLWTWGLDHLFSDKAVYIHIGALIGTCMAGNVYHIIMPGQRYLVAEVEAGRIPDPAVGLKAKLCSIHNNYATLPIIFIMLSNHFSHTYTHQYGWLVLIALIVIGMWIRHYFNLKHRHINKPSILVSGIAAFFALMLAIAPWSSFEPRTNTVQVTNQQAWTIIEKHCSECHSATPTSAMFTSAPLGFVLDSIEDVQKQSEKTYTRAVINKDMPLANLTNMTEEERDTLAIWIEDYRAAKNK
ncbi:hypothetical protein E2R68_13670 [Psychromonas sp. RZ22]|uniref:urate hydroxylase PuuD n=1 Tax=Psychromonas algarum TaxID=2555643 RepID=UPI001068AD18|nr:urate hydroxylase PuuD [Psychromonas sp. RZ22]TEW53124.1 hypothetical protein E2R68_13670 [Psychromonas sp. RZ22]